MRRAIQSALLIALINANNGYCWEWPNFRSWFSTQPSKDAQESFAQAQGIGSGTMSQKYGTFGTWVNKKTQPLLSIPGYVVLKKDPHALSDHYPDEHFLLPKEWYPDTMHKIKKLPGGIVIGKKKPLSKKKYQKIKTDHLISKMKQAGPPQSIFTANIKVIGTQDHYAKKPPILKTPRILWRDLAIEDLRDHFDDKDDIKIFFKLRTYFISTYKKRSVPFSPKAQAAFEKQQQAE